MEKIRIVRIKAIPYGSSIYNIFDIRVPEKADHYLIVELARDRAYEVFSRMERKENFTIVVLNEWYL